jgi:thioredoxin 1
MPTAVTDATFETEVIKSDLPVLVDFYAPWCGPCKVMHPVMEDLAKEYEGKAKIVKMNVDEQSQTAGMFGIMSIPTFIIFKDGKPVKGFMGAQPKESVKQLLDAVLA